MKSIVIVLIVLFGAVFSMDNTENNNTVLEQTPSIIEQFFTIFPIELKNEIYKSVPRYDLFQKISLISKQFYHDMWQQKKEFLVNRYLEYGIFNNNPAYDIEKIDQQFNFFGLNDVFLNQDQQSSIKQYVLDQYNKRRVFTIFKHSYRQREIFTKQKFQLKKLSVMIENKKISYSQYEYDHYKHIATSYFETPYFSKPPRSFEFFQKIFLPFLQHVNSFNGVVRIFLENFSFQTIFNKTIIHCLRQW